MKWNALTVCLVNSDNYVRCNDNAEKYVLDYCGIVKLGAQQGCCYYATLPSAYSGRGIDSVGLRKVVENGNFNLII